jgi:hypothetical protein
MKIPPTEVPSVVSTMSRRPLEAAWVARTPDGQKILAAYRAELAKLQAGNM